MGRNGVVKKKYNNQLVTHLHPKSPVSEAYRTLRTNLQYTLPGGELRSLLVTSAGPDEGKSLTLANLGVIIAQSGKRVLIIDADLRKPSQHKILELSNRAGLTNVLVSTEQIDELVIPTEIDNLYLLPSGPIPPNPAELLNSQRAQDIVNEAKEKYDVVLIDSPPSLAVTDSSLLAKLTDGVLLVIRSGVTRQEPLADTVKTLEKTGTKILGAVLNEVLYNRKEYHYYYYYSDSE